MLRSALYGSHSIQIVFDYVFFSSYADVEECISYIGLPETRFQ